MSDNGVLTPYSTVAPLFQEDAAWVSELDRERITAYETYERIYWSVPHSFRIAMRGTNDQPLYLPTPRTIVNETSHYLLKGLSIAPEGGDWKSPFGQRLDAFLKRERFHSKFSVAKHSGVVRGDWILHITADPTKSPGRRISVNSVDPAAYFPHYADDDLDSIDYVDLVEQFIDAKDNKTYVRRLRYSYVYFGTPGNLSRNVVREEAILEMDEWWNGEAQKIKQVVLPAELLPDTITTIPVYHFKNMAWQGDPFGGSELKGFESVLASINQTMSDEELALALMGLGVYATDAPPPTDDDGNEVDWEIAPAGVVEHPTGSKLYKVDGVSSITPMLDHVKHITEAAFEGSSTFRTAGVDVQLAESGVALAIKFSPTLAKLEQRDLDGLATLENFWYDWKFWTAAYEQGEFSVNPDTDLIAVTLGEKLPINRPKKVEELNNMLDRMVITREYYRSEMKKLGYEFPDDMGEQVRKEQEELTKARMFESPENGDPPGEGNRSNNRSRPNESSGTEVQED